MVNDFIHRDPKSRKHLRVRIELFTAIMIIGVVTILALVQLSSSLNGTALTYHSKLTAESA